MSLFPKNNLSERNYNLLTFALTFGAAAISKKVVKQGWKAITNNTPPENPQHKDYKTGEAIAFTVSMGVVAACVKLFTRQALSKKWKKMGGELPKHLE